MTSYAKSIADHVALQPETDSNRSLAGHVHPDGWVNPTPDGRYNLVVVGGGTAGLVSAAGAAGLGAKVALVERHMLGGDCLVTGCVPSKALIRSARAAAEARRAGELGVRTGPVEVDFPAVMERMRARRADIAHHDAARRFKDLGVDVFLGEGRFTSATTVGVGGQTLEFARAVVATGARAARPPIDGIDDVPILTNESLFSLTELPAHLVVVGGGPIGSEMAQAFARFGAKVTLVEGGPRLLGNDERDAGAVVRAAMERDGVDVRVNARVERLERAGGTTLVHVDGPDGTATIDASHVLLAVGRAPNVERLGLEDAGVDFDLRAGVTVDDRLRTSNPRVYAAGDVASKWKFTHAADFLARNVLRNALFLGRAKASDLVVPWATYTDPEVAHVGQDSADAEAAGGGSIRVELSGNDRAIVDADTEGFAQVNHDRKGRVVGGTVVGPHAGEMIGEITTAVQNRTKLSAMASVIHPYPTVADAIRRAGDEYNRMRLTPFVAKLMRGFLKLRR